MTIGDWLRTAAARLEAAGIESPRLESQVLAAHVSGNDRTWVLSHPEETLDETLANALLDRRQRREPLAYILGYREFFGRRFEVDPRVLIPRQETETLVDVALDHAPSDRRVLDVGTGSGCVAITLKLERPGLIVTATDISEEALQVARANAAFFGAEVEFIHSDLYSNLGGRVFDLIVSNPPYIGRSEELQPEVGSFEPAAALFGGEEGSEIIERLARGAGEHLSDGGWFAMEFGYLQAKVVRDLILSAGFVPSPHVRDLAGTERIALAHKSGK